MTPSPEQQEHIKIAQRAALRNAQAFQMFTMMVAGGKRPKDALQEADDAMEVWSEYQDAHTIEPPVSPSMGEVLDKLSGMADRLGRPSENQGELFAIDPHDVIEASRDIARQSRDLLAPELQKAFPPTPTQNHTREGLIAFELEKRMNLVMDCFNTGAAMMLKMLHGDHRPEPWLDDYDHEERLRSMLAAFGLLAGHLTAHPPAMDPSSQTKGGSPKDWEEVNRMRVKPGLSTEKENL